MRASIVLAVLFPLTAHANGQTTHLWITDEAVRRLESGELKSLLEDYREPLRVGSMFADGGYAVDHGYGEAAHWEPFQDAYRDWIRNQYPDISVPEAAPHIAFYLGLASHGMADQVFDSMYMERSKVYDATHGWADESTSLDTAQDIVFVSETLPQELPYKWIPSHFPELFASIGVDVDMDTLDFGQSRLEVAVSAVGGLGAVDDTVAINQQAFPWGCSHLLDEAVPGSPPFEAAVVARYWTHLWRELHGEAGELEVIASFPSPDAIGHSPHANDIEARLSLVFSRGLTDDTVTEDHFRVTSSESELSLALDLFYGNHSHVVNIDPPNGWLENSAHLLTVSQMVVATDGRTMDSDHTLSFSTVPPPPPEEEEQPDTGGEEPRDQKQSACGCSLPSAASGTWGLIVLSGLLGWRRRRG